MRTYLVTGGMGFIGSNFIYYMFQKYGDDITIINVDKLTYAGNLENLAELGERPNHIFKKYDICDREKITELFAAYDIDYVVNFAAETHVDRSIVNPDVFVLTNVHGTSVLLDEAKKHWETGEGFKPGKKFLQVSTDEVYGALGDEGYFTETTPLNPHSPYSAAKAGADHLVKAYFDTYHMPVNITRCSNNYGPYQFPEKLIPLMVNNALAGKDLPMYGDGKNVRDWLFVEDHCKAIDLVLERGTPGEVYNIGGHNEKENIEIAHIIINTLQEFLPANDPRKLQITPDLIKFVKDRKGHDRRYAIDPTKISSELGWEPETCFAVGIRKTIQWYLEHASWMEHVTSGEYQNYYKAMYGD